MALTGEQEKAAALVAADTLSDPQILEQLAINSRQTLLNWKRRPEFMARVEEIRAEIRARVRARGIAIVENRVQALQDRWDLMQRVIAERAEDPQFRGVAGGSTGLLVHTVKGVGRGEDFQLVDLYEVDTGLLRELREHEAQAAKELGQWVDRKSLESTQKIEITEVEVVLDAEGPTA